MTISGNRESAGRTLSTADLAAAARRSNTIADDDGEAVSNNELRKPPPTGREATAEGSEASEIQDREAPRGTERAASFEQGRAGQREAEADADRRPPATADHSSEELVALFSPDLAQSYRSRWISIQSSFVDDPRKAVRSGDELVAQVMTNLADTFADERHRVETQLDATGEGSTENLRVALRRYHSFFERLLSL